MCQIACITIMEKSKKTNRGGKREGAGRPRNAESSKLYTFRIGGKIASKIDEQPNKTEFIKGCIVKALESEDYQEPDFTSMGTVFPATRIKDMTLPFFDISVVAGFPIPLDNDERAQDIELLKLLCPNPEASYLIRVDGNSMIDAGIYSGDIVIVDKSNRNPSRNEVAVCELNGEYTLKHFEKRGGCGWLIPANPDFPEIKVTEDDDFSVWGTVTYIIHKPKS